jgi:hypothetical protein
MKATSGEFVDAPIPDKRLRRRLPTIAALAETDPAATFPQMARSDGELEAIYRFLNNPRVKPEAILEPHRRATVVRASSHRCVGMAHDTTQFAFQNASGKALGVLPSTGQRGFFCHVALAVAPDGAALGVLGMEPYFFETNGTDLVTGRPRLMKKAESTSARWTRMADEAAAQLPEGTEAIHLMDREADDYKVVAELVAAQQRFVIRVQKRTRPACADGSVEWETVQDIARRATYRCERLVALSKRRTKAGLNGQHGSRARRRAWLQVDAVPVTIRRPRLLTDEETFPCALNLNMVRVHEPYSPKDAQPVEWLLMTTEPIDTQADVEAIVDWYRSRWRVEELFKALKTGCSFEKRQLESRQAILRALALLLPLAWQLLALRTVGREEPSQPATKVLSPRQLIILRAASKTKLPDAPTIADALLAIAAQGGHLRRNGAPGWQTLGRGLEKLLWAEVGYMAAIAEYGLEK